MVYYALFHYDVEGVSVRFPDLPGCLTCGKNTEEAAAMAAEALAGFLEVLAMDGDGIPEPGTLVEALGKREDGEVVYAVKAAAA